MLNLWIFGFTAFCLMICQYIERYLLNDSGMVALFNRTFKLKHVK